MKKKTKQKEIHPFLYRAREREGEWEYEFDYGQGLASVYAGKTLKMCINVAEPDSAMATTIECYHQATANCWMLRKLFRFNTKCYTTNSSVLFHIG